VSSKEFDISTVLAVVTQFGFLALYCKDSGEELVHCSNTRKIEDLFEFIMPESDLSSLGKNGFSSEKDKSNYIKITAMVAILQQCPEMFDISIDICDGSDNYLNSHEIPGGDKLKIHSDVDVSAELKPYIISMLIKMDREIEKIPVA